MYPTMIPDEPSNPESCFTVLRCVRWSISMVQRAGVLLQYQAAGESVVECLALVTRFRVTCKCSHQLLWFMDDPVGSQRRQVEMVKKTWGWPFPMRTCQLSRFSMLPGEGFVVPTAIHSPLADESNQTFCSAGQISALGQTSVRTPKTIIVQIAPE